MDITHITSLLGGIALFLYGMSIMGAGLEKLAGGHENVPGVAGNLVVLGKGGIAGFLVQHTAHELVGQDVLEIVQHNDAALCAAHELDDLRGLVGDKDVAARGFLFVEVGPAFRTEGERLLHRLNQ